MKYLQAVPVLVLLRTSSDELITEYKKSKRVAHKLLILLTI